jgi:hypothetical protein
MKTQRSVWRDGAPDQAVEAPVEAEIAVQGDIPDAIETTQAVSEEIKPLSPQFAALAKAKRELQVKESSLLAREKALADQSVGKPGQEELINRLKSDPLSVLQEHGVTYDQLTEAILSNQSERNPTVLKLEEEIKAIKAGLEGRDKSQIEQQAAQKQQVLNQMANDADRIIAQGDEYEMVRETGSRPDVIKLIEKTFDTTGEVLDVEEALKLVEDELIEESLKIARIKKVQGRLNPVTQEVTQPKQVNSNVRVMRTLTNRDGASVPSSAKERAIAAFHGRNK